MTSFATVAHRLPRGILQALGEPPVADLAGASSLAARRTLELKTTALGKLDRAGRGSTSSGGGSGSGSGGGDLDEGGGGDGSSRGSSRGGAGGAVPDGRAGEGEGLGASVDAEVGVGVGGLVGAGELDHGTGAAVSAAGDLDLDAGDEVLGLVDVGPVDAWGS
jgi:hypothetical protein